MIDEQLRAAIDAANAREGTKGSPAWINPRCVVDEPTPPVDLTPQPKVPTARPEPVASQGARPEPTGGGGDLRELFDVDAVVDRLQSGTPSMAGFRDRPAVVNAGR